MPLPVPAAGCDSGAPAACRRRLTPLSASTSGRRAFTLVELLVVIAIIAAIIGIVFVSFGETLGTAQAQQQKVGLSPIHGALEARLDAFADLVQRAEMGQDTGRVYLDVSLRAGNLFEGYNQYSEDEGTMGSPNTPFSITPNAARALVIHELYRGLFPQRLEDMFGLDGEPNTADDSPLLAAYANQHAAFLGNVDTTYTTPVAVLAQCYDEWSSLAQGYNPNTLNKWQAVWHREINSGTTSSELLVLMLTTQIGLNAPPISLSDIDRLAGEGDGQIDTDGDGDNDNEGDGLPDLATAQGEPFRFYSYPTRLVRPAGDDTSVVGTTPAGVSFPISYPEMARAKTLVNELPTFAVDAYSGNGGRLPATFYDVDGDDTFDPTDGDRVTATHPLNTDPYDRLRELDGVFLDDFKVSNYFGSGNTGGSSDELPPFSEANYWTRNTHFVPLIVSPGPDNELGMLEPWSSDVIDASGATVSTTTNGAFEGAARLGFIPPSTRDDVRDNVTNRKRVLQ